LTRPLHATRVDTEPIRPTRLRLVPVDALRTVGARRLLGIWRTKRIDHILPSERTMAPGRFRDLADNLYRLDVEPLSQRLRFGFVGQEVRRRFGEDLAGRCLDQAGTLPDRALHDEGCRTAMREARPVGAMVQGTRAGDGRPAMLELVILPLTHGLRMAEGVICGVFEVECDADRGRRA
jgi:hypothetical protein